MPAETPQLPAPAMMVGNKDLGASQGCGDGGDARPSARPEAQPTPGPWEVGELDRNGQRIVTSEHTEIATCWHHCVVELERQMEVNARLIAAAPDLLEAAQSALWALMLHFGNVDPLVNPIIEQTSAAVEKALGTEASTPRARTGGCDAPGMNQKDSSNG